MYNWDPFSIVKFVTGSPFGHLSISILMIIFLSLPYNWEFNDYKNYTIWTTLISHLVCLGFSLIQKFINDHNK